MPTQPEFWDKIALKYDKRTVKGPNYAARIDRTVAWAGDGAEVLDVGCAGGQITLDLAKRVKHVQGIDLSAKLIEIAEARRIELGVENASFVQTTAEDESLAEGAFDAVTAYSVLHLVDDVPATLRRFHALLRPGGRVIAEVPCKRDIAIYLRLLLKLMTMVGKAPTVRVYSQADYERMFAEAGFRIDQVKVYNPKSMSRFVLATRVD